LRSRTSGRCSNNSRTSSEVFIWRPLLSAAGRGSLSPVYCFGSLREQPDSVARSRGRYGRLPRLARVAGSAAHDGAFSAAISLSGSCPQRKRLGIEGLERFVRKKPLCRVHECVFGVLALEIEQVGQRLWEMTHSYQ